MLKATRVEDVRNARDIPGAYDVRSIEGKVAGLGFICPCGCGTESWLPLDDGRRGWHWNGNPDAPVLTPSVFNSGLPCQWHGWLGGSDGKHPGMWVSV